MKNSRSDRLRYGRIVSIISLVVILSASFSQPASAFKTDQKASLVIGQSSFTTSICSGGFLGTGTPTQSGLCDPAGSEFDSSGNLWVADFYNARVLKFKPPFSNGESASLVIGQSSFTTRACSTTQSGLCRPDSLAFDSLGNLWVTEFDNSRVLEFTPPFSNGESASLVIGQSSFTTNTCSGANGGTPTQSGLCQPGGSAFDSSGNFWVTDSINDRVLEFKPPFSNGESASLVIGQSSFTTNTCSGAFGSTPPTQSGLCQPGGSAFDSSGNLWVADNINSRVLEFKPPFSNGESASLVIGQSSFTTSICSGGGFLGTGTPTQSGLCLAVFIAFDFSGNLWVADSFNSRVLKFTLPFSNGESASLVIGQSSFTTGACIGGSFFGTLTQPTQRGLCGPHGIAFDSRGNLWVADGPNSRVLAFADQGHHL